MLPRSARSSRRTRGPARGAGPYLPRPGSSSTSSPPAEPMVRSGSSSSPGTTSPTSSRSCCRRACPGLPSRRRCGPRRPAPDRRAQSRRSIPHKPSARSVSPFSPHDLHAVSTRIPRVGVTVGSLTSGAPTRAGTARGQERTGAYATSRPLAGRDCAGAAPSQLDMPLAAAVGRRPDREGNPARPDDREGRGVCYGWGLSACGDGCRAYREIAVPPGPGIRLTQASSLGRRLPAGAATHELGRGWRRSC